MMDFFNHPLHRWYSLYKRDLPWRNTSNPYFIWVSEIILQQTRIGQGMAYYIKFTGEFPTVSALAGATEDQILKLWQGLGYYSRARNMHFTAQYIYQNCNGIFPQDYQTIRSLKGIGEYTAAAIASISFNMEYPVVDGNVYRVLSRYFGIFDPIDTSSGKKIFNDLATELIKGTIPGMHNQAIMEFGALQCTPKNPDCNQCPLNESCFAFSENSIDKLPFKQNKIRQRNRFFNYLVIKEKNHTYLRKRVLNDIWKNLYEFPMLESMEKSEINLLIENLEFQKLFMNRSPVIGNVSNWKIHILSHQRIHYRFIEICITGEINLSCNLIKVNKEDIFNFAVPKLLEIYLNEGAKNA